MPTIMFVCSGNICRSAMAQGIARARLGAEGIEFISAGTWAGFGSPATPQAVAAAAGIGVDITGHRSRPLDSVAPDDVDLVYGMTADHLAAWPGAELLDADGSEIEDPYGRSDDFYAGTCARIEAAIDARAGEWLSLTR